MTTYRLPDALGGGEVRTARDTGGADIDVWVEEDFVITIPRNRLTEVLPPEPHLGGEFFAAGTDGNLLPIFRLWSDIGWCNVSTGEDVTWQQICDISKERAGRWPVQLVVAAPAPAELPWEFTDADAITGRVTASPWGAGNRYDVMASIRGGDILGMNATQAREMAAALITAADKAKAVQS